MRSYLARRGMEYSKKEMSMILFTAFSFAAVFFLQKWRTTDFNRAEGVSYFIFLLIACLALVFFIISWQKRHGHSKGYKVEYENNVGFVLVAIIITFLFQGFIIILLPGFIILQMHMTRIGHFRMEINDKDVGMTSLMASVACLIAFIVVFVLYLATKNFIFSDLMKMSMATALFILVPTPKNNGIAIFKWSRMTYVFSLLAAFLIFLAASVGEPSLLLGVLGGMVVHFFIGIFDLFPRLMYGS
jgi:hypothetical protein